MGGDASGVPATAALRTCSPKAWTGIAPARGQEESVPGEKRERESREAPRERMGSMTWVHCRRRQAGREMESEAFYLFRLSKVKANRAECRKHFNRRRIFETCPAMFSLLLISLSGHHHKT